MRRVQMQGVGNAFEIKIPATENNLVYIEVAIAKPHSNHKPKIYNKYTHRKRKCNPNTIIKIESFKSQKRTKEKKKQKCL